ncbi:phosphate ABC transporter permease PstA [Halegenticoccus tardaugens]|uniref:phosphate ABC transporter permease PstA n=1 Tax=Halegenticoccus tardaugens TaxID=2071624 RepID=UPI00100B2D95|nr:phosphate ABC transporter permease PstA [Halegenticoccus tardaugens]
MATERGKQSWFGASGEISRLPGRLFAALCLGATLFAILAVFSLLAVVANDAINPATADTEWHLTFLVTLVLPATALVAYLISRTDDDDVWIGMTALGIPLYGLLLGLGVLLLFIDVFNVFGWLASVLAIAVAVSAIVGHRRVRSGTGIVEQLLVVGIALGVLAPATYIGVVNVPVLPTAWLIYLLTFGLPGATLAGLKIARDRGNQRDGIIAGALVLAVAVAGAFVMPFTGLGPEVWIILFTFGGIPTVVYFESVMRERDRPVGLLLPVVVMGGAIAGGILAEVFGFAGPEAWLDYQFLTSAPSRFPDEAGIYPAMIGTIMMMVVIVVASFPVGVGAAIYLEEYAPSGGPLGKVVKLIEINIGNLAGVPSVVYGILGLALFVNWFNFQTGIVIVGGMTVALLILPIIIISAQEAIRAVPDTLRQASYGMGATRWQTVRRVVLPRALPGILTGSILAFGRAIGETAPLLMIGAAANVYVAPENFFDIYSAMPRQIFAWVAEPSTDFQYGVMAAGVVTLLVVLLSMNAAAILIRNKYQRRS